MARPKKDTVDYFPHDCHHSRELEIFINKHGSEGYAFYFRLLELLGITPDHRYDCNKSINYEYLLTITDIQKDRFEILMETLVSLDVVDEKLWGKRIIWVQSFVDSIAEVYARRTTDLPTIDSFCVENPSFRSRNPQSKLNYKEESVVKNSPHTDIPNWVAEIGKQYPRVDVNRSFFRYKTYRSEKGRPVNEDGFLLWVIDDDRKGMNLKKKEKPTHTMYYCVGCDFKKQAPADKTYGHICEKCEDQMVEKHELAAFRNPITKVGQ